MWGNAKIKYEIENQEEVEWKKVLQINSYVYTSSSTLNYFSPHTTVMHKSNKQTKKKT